MQKWKCVTLGQNNVNLLGQISINKYKQIKNEFFTVKTRQVSIDSHQNLNIFNFQKILSLKEQQYFILHRGMQTTQPSFLSNNSSPQKGPNFTVQANLPNSLTPPKEPIHDHNGEGHHHQLPKNSAEIVQFMKKKPFTQYLGGIQITYSLLPKKQASFLMTNERFLMLKGHQSISYARVFPQEKQLPFKTYEDLIPAKATFHFSEIVKVEPSNNEKLVIHFQKNQKKLTWEFVCPSPSCSLQWRKKIEEALNAFRGIEERNVHPLAISIYDRQGNKFASQIANNVGNSNFSVEANSPIKRNAPQVESPNKIKPLSVQFQGPNMSKVQDLIVDPKTNIPQQQLFLGKSMSKITSDEKQDFKFQLTKIKRNWIQQLLGGQQEGELIIDFRNYVQKISTVIISQLYLPQDQKIFPNYQQNSEFASYLLDDVYIQIYFINKETIDRKHPRYQLAKLQFKNMDYLLGVTENQGILKVPFIVLFEYKGFLGMAKSKVGDNFTPKNRQCYSQLNIKEFETISRINAQTLLNQSKCRILSYQRKSSISYTQSQRVYFVDILTELLPLQKGDFSSIPSKPIRPQLVQDDQLDGVVFRDNKRPIRTDKIAKLIDQKENQLLKILQNEQQYFTNSRELTDLLHESGLNMRRLGSVFQKSRLIWLKKILQAQLLARSLKIYYKFDIQSCIRIQTQRLTTKERQQEIEHRRVISFLNVLFGVSDSTSQLWKRVNAYCKNHFGVFAFQNNFTDIHIPFFLQAIQTHLRIVLTDRTTDRQFFKTSNCFQMADFIRFEFESSIYDLDFTSTFQQIEECLEDKSPDSFTSLSEILIKQTSTRIPYFQFLRNHPIHERICQFLLDFTSPEQSKDLYNRLETNPLPNRFLYESKLAEVKWYLKQGKLDQIQHPVNFIFGHAFKWLGEVHPLFVQINRILASFFCDNAPVASRALKYATNSLEIHKKIFGNDYEIMWIDYLYLGKAYFATRNIEQTLTNLSKAKSLVKPQQLKQYQNYSQLNLVLCRAYISQKKFKEAYTAVIQLYNLIKKEKDQQSLSNTLECVSLIRQIYQVNREYEPFFQFLQKDLCNNLNSFSFYPELLNAAIRLLTVSTLRHTILRRSKNKTLLMSLVEEISKVAHSAKGNLINYIGLKIKNGSFPLTFLKQLKEADSLMQDISNRKLLDSWFSFYPNAEQATLDNLGNLGRGENFIVNLTALYNLYGKSMLDQIHLMDK